MLNHVEIERIVNFLKHPFEVNQEIGFALLKELVDLSDNRIQWNELMTDSIQKLRFCLAYELEKEVQFIKLKKVDYSEASKVCLVESFVNLEQLILMDQNYPNFSWMIKWSKLTSLKVLSLSRNCLTIWPFELDYVPRLSQLYLGGNKFTKLSAEIANSKSLEVLVLSANRLRKLPTQLATLKKLRHLNVARNYLERIGAELFSLPNLEELYLQGNQLKVLPEAIGKLRKIRRLNLAYNQLVSLPEGLYWLDSLEELNLKGNPVAQDEGIIYPLQEALPNTHIIL